jgi:hypothetical protein
MRLRRPRPDDSSGVEDPVARQYRFLLRTAPADALEAAHAEGLRALAPEVRQAVLGAVQQGLVAGQRLGPDEVDTLGHLIVNGERRDPGSFLRACSPGALGALSQAVVESDATFGLFTRYVDWDGAEPEPADDSAWAAAGFNPDSGRWNTARGPGRDATGLPHSGGAGPGFGGGDGGGFG